MKRVLLIIAVDFAICCVAIWIIGCSMGATIENAKRKRAGRCA